MSPEHSHSMHHENPINLRGVLQGPMGSELRKRGIVDRGSQESDVAHRAIHQAYCEAGAHIAVADTFGATPLRRHGVSGKLSLGRDRHEQHFGPIHTSINHRMIALAREAFGEDALVAGSIAPITDTSGKHDHFWRQANPKLRDAFSMDRHAPQVNALMNGGADMLWGEAFRYMDEAKALAHLAEEFKAKALAVCFEANAKGLPFVLPGEPTTFQTLKEELSKIAPHVQIWVGANCTGLRVIKGILERGEKLDILYANSLDFNGDQRDYGRYAKMKNANRPEDQQAILATETQHTTPIENVVQFAEWAFQNGVQVVGGCCGTTPDLTRQLRAIWDRLEDGKLPQVVSA